MYIYIYIHIYVSLSLSIYIYIYIYIYIIRELARRAAEQERELARLPAQEREVTFL